MTANMLGHFIQRISKKLFDIPISVSDIRHSFIAENNIHNTDDIELLYKNAYQMGHTYRVATNIYRKNYEESG
jgi:hypothetical protein